MAISQNSLQSYDLQGNKLSFANWISNLSPTDTPFVSMTGKEAISQTMYQWQTDYLDKANGANAHAEGEEVDAEVRKPTKMLENYTQILNKVIKVSDTSNALANYGRGQELQYQMEKAGKELKRDLEVAFLRKGQAKQKASASTNGIGKFDGFYALVSKVADIDDTQATVYKQDTLTEDTLFDLTNNLYLAGSNASIIMFHPKHASFFSGLVEEVDTTDPDNIVRARMFDGNSTKFNQYVSTLVDPLGQEFKLIPNRWMDDDLIYFFTPSDWTQMVLRAPTRTKLAKDGSYEKWMIEMEVGLRHRNPFASGILEINSTSVAHNFTLDTGTGTVTQSGNTVTVNAAPAAGALSIAIDPELASAIVAGSVVPATATADFSDFATDGFTVTIKAAGQTSGTIVADGVTYTVNINVVAPKGVNGKVVPAGKTGGDTLTDADLFAYSNSATKADVTGVTLTPTAAGTWDNTAKTLKLADTASGDVAIAFTVGTGVTKGSTAPKVTAVKPKLSGFTMDKTAGSVKADGSDNVVVTLTAAPTGATLGTVTATAQSGKKLKATVAGNKVTIAADTNAAATTDNGTVTIAVAGVTATQDVTITVTA